MKGGNTNGLKSIIRQGKQTRSDLKRNTGKVPAVVYGYGTKKYFS